MVESFASPADVEARWRTLSDTEEQVAVTLIEDAADMIRTRWPDVDSRIASGALSDYSVARVVAGMVKRAMQVGASEGLESRSQTAGPFVVSDTYSNPNANLFLNAEDIRLFEGFFPKARVGWLM